MAGCRHHYCVVGRNQGFGPHDLSSDCNVCLVQSLGLQFGQGQSAPPDHEVPTRRNPLTT